MTSNPKSLFFDWLTAPAEKSGQQVSSSRFGSKNRNVYLFIFFPLFFSDRFEFWRLFLRVLIQRRWQRWQISSRGCERMSLLLLLFFYLLPQGVGTSEWKKVFFFLSFIYLFPNVCPRIYSWWFEISVGIQHEHTYNADLFFLLVFFFCVCVSWTYSKAGPYFVILLCSFFFFFFVFEIQRSWHPYNNNIFFSIEEFVALFLVGWEFHFFDERRESFELQISKEKFEADTNGIDFLWKTIFESPAADAVLPQNYKCRCVCA